MCGLAGVYTNTGVLVDAELENARKLLILNHFRGSDSAGLMWFNKEPKKKQPAFAMDKWHNHPLYVSEVTWPKIHKEIWDKQDVNMVGIHCRSATIGKVEVGNAHPFKHGHIIGMHNGTISSDFTNKNKFGTDSEALIYNIAHAGIEDAIKDLDIGYPAYALVWLDTKERTLNFLRNGARPLHILTTGGTMYWSSDKKDLEYVFYDKTKATTFKGKTKHGHEKDTALYLQIHQHYKIDLDAGEDITWEMKEIKPNEKQSYYPPYSEWVGELGTNNTTTTKPTPPTGAEIRSTSKDKRQQGLPIFEDEHAYKDILWRLLSQADLKMIESTHLGFTYPNNPSDKKRYYVIECDGWVQASAYLSVILWRMNNWETSLQLMKRVWSTSPADQQSRILNWADITRSQMEMILRGKYHEYHMRPFMFDGHNRKRAYPVFMTHELADAAAMAQTGRERRGENDNVPFQADNLPDTMSASTESKGEVIVFPDTKKDSTASLPMSYPYGLPTRFGTKLEITKQLYKGCVYCDESHDWDNYLESFWVGPEDYLCKTCQDDAIDGTIDIALIPNHNQLREFVIQREERAKALAKVANAVTTH